MGAPWGGEQRGEQRRIVEQRIEPLLSQGGLAAVAGLGALLGHQRQREGGIVTGQAGADVGQDHRGFLQSVVWTLLRTCLPFVTP